MSFSLAAKKDKAASNPLSSKASKNPFKQKTATTMDVRQKPMSNAERIMKQEMERERLAEERGGKRRRLA
jgi:DNA/RNA-binding protein KIN17